jgi:uncharacterized protein YutE (UPF0331/DUF86 family)
MVFKEGVVRERLGRIDEVVARLSRFQAQPAEEFSGDADRQWVVERGLAVAAEAVAAVGVHILSGRFEVCPEDHEGAIVGLGGVKVISPPLVEALRALEALRQRLVHDDERVDAGDLHRSLAELLGSLRSFEAEVSSWLTV